MTNIRFILRSAAIATAATLAMPAAAAVVTSLPGGTAIAIPATNLTFTGATQTIAQGITAAPQTTFTFGYTGGYSFGSNGNWSGSPLIGLDLDAGSFDIRFASAVSGFLGEINWGTFTSGTVSIAAYDSAGALLESLTLRSGNANQVAPGFYGFSRGTADIASIRFGNDYIAVRNILILQTAAVPEPATWLMMILGFGAMGFAMRRKNQQVSVRFA